MEIKRDHINKMIQAARLLGPDKKCKDYPCHFDGQDCTWCFCPFYPCEDESTGGGWTKDEWAGGEIVWGCKNCNWIHTSKVAKCVLSEFLGIAKTIEEIPQKKLVEIRLKILEGGGLR